MKALVKGLGVDQVVVVVGADAKGAILIQYRALVVDAQRNGHLGNRRRLDGRGLLTTGKQQGKEGTAPPEGR
jgi:hypothetical protein